MMLGHPRLCDVLNQAAQGAGATLLREVGSVSVEPGLPPTVAFVFEGGRHTVRPRLVVGADGRGSSTARQIGTKAQTEPVHHLIAGLLVDDVHGWPEDEHMHLYPCYALEERGRFAGSHAAKHFLEAFRVPSLPHADEIARGRIAEPCQGYPNADTWMDEPIAPGVVLIRDAAGHNDPTIGQGLSITTRDVSLVSEALSQTVDWHENIFAGYAAERQERMRRLRLNARLTAKLRCEFDHEADLTRSAVARRIAQDRSAARPLMVPLLGPFGVPDETFEEPAFEKLFGEQWPMAGDGWFQQQRTFMQTTDLSSVLA